jgi:hypothetical protein
MPRDVVVVPVSSSGRLSAEIMLWRATGGYSTSWYVVSLHELPWCSILPRRNNPWRPASYIGYRIMTAKLIEATGAAMSSHEWRAVVH